MSAAINLGDAAIGNAYNSVRAGNSGWVIYTLTATNELKVQEESQDGDLDELKEEFSDGKMQIAFARVTDQQSKLQKFVLINWCGGGVPVARKSRFNQHAADVSRVLTGAHVVLQARSEADVEPSLIMKRVAEAGGAKYSIHNEQPSSSTQRMERPAPVGSNYTPIGRPDIAAMSNAGKREAPAAVGTTWQPKHNELNDIRAKAAADREKSSTQGKSSVVTAPTNPPPVPAASRPVLPPPSGSNRPTAPPFASSTSATPSQPKEESKATSSYEPPAPVGTSYTPVTVGKVGKLSDRMGAFQQQPSSAASGGFDGSSSVGAGSGGKKLTWSERQAATKKLQAEEEAASKAAIDRAIPAAPAATAVPQPPKAPSPPPLNISSRPSVPTGAIHGAEEADRQASVDKLAQEDEINKQTSNMDKLDLNEIDEAAAVPRPLGESAISGKKENGGGKGQTARVLFDYSPEEDNELALKEGEVVENVEMIDEGWWSGQSNGNTGLFPANYVELIETEEMPEAEEQQKAPSPPPQPPRAPSPPAQALAAVAHPSVPMAPPPPPLAPQAPQAPPAQPRQATPEPEPKAGPEQTLGPRARALYDYTADEDNELSFAEGDEITDIEFSSEDWWTGSCGGARGLFPSNYSEMID